MENKQWIALALVAGCTVVNDIDVCDRPARSEFNANARVEGNQSSFAGGVAAMPTGGAFLAFRSQVSADPADSRTEIRGVLVDGEGGALPTAGQPNEFVYAPATGDRGTFEVRGSARVTPPDTEDGIGVITYLVTDETDSRVEATFILGSGGFAANVVAEATFVVDAEPAPTCNLLRNPPSAPSRCALNPVAVAVEPTVDGTRRDFVFFWRTNHRQTGMRAVTTIRTRKVQAYYGAQLAVETRAEPSGAAFDVVTGSFVSDLDAILLTEGRILLVWQELEAGDQSVVYSQVMSAGLSVEVPRTEIGRSPDGVPARTGISLAKSGERLIATWGDHGPGGSDRVVFRMMDADGQVIDDGQRVLVTGPGGQRSPSATGLVHREGFALAWEADGDPSHEDTSDSGVRMVLLDGHGEALFANSACGAEDFQLNEEHLGAQNSPALTTLLDGSVLATWAGNDISGSGVRTRSFRLQDLFPIER